MNSKEMNAAGYAPTPVKAEAFREAMRAYAKTHAQVEAGNAPYSEEAAYFEIALAFAIDLAIHSGSIKAEIVRRGA